LTSSTAAPDDIQYPLATVLIPLAIQNTHLFAALLADVQFWYGGTLLQKHDHETQSPTTSPLKLSLDALFYRSQAISHIRQKIVDLQTSEDDSGKVPDDALLIAVTYLMGLDVSIG
jgi:hypothetical protein